IAQLCAFAYVTRGDTKTALDLLSRVIDQSDASGMLGRAVLARGIRADALWRAGRWSESLAQLSQMESLQDATNRRQLAACASAVRARIEAGLGREEACRHYTEQTLEASVPLASHLLTVWALSGRGLLALGAQRYAEAAADFDRVVAIAGHMPEPGFLWWHADAVEAYHGCGRAEDARDALARLDRLADATGRAWAGAAADRCAALLGVDDDPAGRLDAALAGFRAVGAPFEEARTLLTRGEVLIAAGDRRQGAVDVAAARTIFDRLGARTWSERASRLRGEASRTSPSLASRLSPAELRVALAVGDGATNREAAKRLYLSVKTVDYHLQGIYRKLGLRGRAQLATLVAADRGGLPDAG
ncbi:MAG TPA: helix-turn-helix transcriptional regulator, partial [Acidimicrobiales bacterium]|nr:helix-turn-helix transcriptional regulator [Acidimicrobiales bacterium]